MHCGRPERSADHTPAEIAVSSERIEDRRLVRPLECTGADVDDAGLERLTIVRGPAHLWWKAVERRG